MPLLTVESPAVVSMTCQIIEERISDYVQFWLRFKSSSDVAGRYTLVVTKSDTNGTSNTQQSGAVVLQRGKAKDIGLATMNVADEVKLRAIGFVEVADQRIVCESDGVDRL